MAMDVGGLPGYRGFEYQIEATLWVSLTMMIEHRLCVEVIIEPSSAEDLEFTLTNTDRTFNVDIVTRPDKRLTLQFKTRSTGPWTKAIFSKVVGTGTSAAHEKRGPAPRVRALEHLLQHHDTTYLLVTDAAVESSLFALVRNSVVSDSDAPIPQDFLDPTIVTSASHLKGRIGIIQALTRELLGYRTKDLLSRFAKIPFMRIDDCAAELKERVRRRLLGSASPTFSFDELRSKIEEFGGTLDGGYDPSYYPPDALEEIEAALATQHIIVLLGAPGVGKTSLADHLARRHELGEIPFQVHRDGVTVGQITSCLKEMAPHLFFISDPWGITETKGATSMTHELTWLMRSAGPDKKFVITSRTDVYAGVSQLSRSILGTFLHHLTPKSYSEETRWKIAAHHVKDNPIAVRVMSSYREDILSSFHTPAELESFGVAFSKISHTAMEELHYCMTDEVGAAPPHRSPFFESIMVSVPDLIRQTVGLVSGQYVPALLAEWPHPVEHIATSWAIFQSFERISERDLYELLGAAGPSISLSEVTAFIAFLIDSGIAREQDEMLSIHSVRLRRMQDFIEPFKADANVAVERVVRHCVSSATFPYPAQAANRAVEVISTWSTFARVSRLTFAKSTTLIERLIGDLCLTADDDQFVDGVYLAMQLDYANDPFVRLVQSFRPGESDSTPPWYGPMLPDEVTQDVVRSGKAKRFLPHFVETFMPNTNIGYGSVKSELARFLMCFQVNLAKPAERALDMIYDRRDVDRGDYGAYDGVDLELNAKPLQEIYKLFSGRAYPEPIRPPALPDWDLY